MRRSGECVTPHLCGRRTPRKNFVSRPSQAIAQRQVHQEHPACHVLSPENKRAQTEFGWQSPPHYIKKKLNPLSRREHARDDSSLSLKGSLGNFGFFSWLRSISE